MFPQEAFDNGWVSKPFYPIAEAEKVCNRHIREYLPPPTNG
jgi:hypothetical protein